MQALKYIELTEEIFEKLKVKELLETFAGYTGRNAQESTTPDEMKKASKLFLDIHSGVSAIENDPALLELFKTLRFDRFFNHEYLSRLISHYQSQHQVNALREHQFVKELRQFLEYISGFLASLTTTLRDDRLKKVGQDQEVLNIVVYQEQAAIQIEQLEQALHSLKRIGDALGEIEKCDSKLEIAFLDSGSNVWLAIFGNSKVIDSLRKFFSDLWDKLLYHNNNKFERNLKSVGKSLTIISRIEQMKADKQIDNETALRLENSIVDSCESILRNGVITREILENEQESISNTKLLEGARQLLLEAPKNDAE